PIVAFSGSVFVTALTAKRCGIERKLECSRVMLKTTRSLPFPGARRRGHQRSRADSLPVQAPGVLLAATPGRPLGWKRSACAAPARERQADNTCSYAPVHV